MNSGQAVKTLMNVKGANQASVAEKLGIERAAVAGRLIRGNLTVGAINEMLAIVDPEAKVCIVCKDGTKFVLDDMPNPNSKRGKIKTFTKKKDEIPKKTKPPQIDIERAKELEEEPESIEEIFEKFPNDAVVEDGDVKIAEVFGEEPVEVEEDEDDDNIWG